MKQRHTRRVRRDEKAAHWRKMPSYRPLWANVAPTPALLELDARIRNVIIWKQLNEAPISRPQIGFSPPPWAELASGFWDFA